ncbi:hypothetical protein CNY89_15765 [Amaricoccus sp. HAR-UPW-R2A-40]|nr:hypothetical protein CNY89_15765 [Amaricoccus sp. HAR-UPW-R2A-40]
MSRLSGLQRVAEADGAPTLEARAAFAFIPSMIVLYAFGDLPAERDIQTLYALHDGAGLERLWLGPALIWQR